ncbi:MAG TPA: bifunctional aspartate kinase/homoserine dehydrogenase I [Prolixibacteraceae bacterium]|jgi:aspartokinase/homoserine dehydrogenase 1|nr:bifunctional aspartate kinase/homoserine dehydrogenase I [Prolixibacteraceae bacterium]NLS98735.1 bifunctional aspartate kinase/homoserine dehydrogenase I [Bacteroidales bacterium]HOC87302.1 bifunctional aspartate kinase/homoserine dehydrogenase I [Prolixibacteraceae bacterium]HOY92794.1 bifunctional aspartate kinase/homoserine dehydrogenase I [Prolixibacteraceae bacterium]HPI35352.1 bifunctional aspartate kinase/homoserine dehydrogenase I [Prolixibacteraceae bacterium]
MKVLKFGGTSIGTAGNIRKVKEILSRESGDVLVVVSALGGVTDQILLTARMAASGKRDFHPALGEIRERHRALIRELYPGGNGVDAKIEAILRELEQVLTGIALVTELTSKTLDRILSMGERMSSNLIAPYLGATLVDSAGLIVTDSSFGKAAVDFSMTTFRIGEALGDFHGKALAPGFIARSKDGDYTTLGRGGSDYSASIFAAILGAESLEIWTDVDGFMTADPRVIDNAYTIPHLTYAEAMELSNFGAKVIYPPTILPVYKKEIPVLIKNTMHPEAPGTMITKTSLNGREKPIKGISSIPGIALITIQGIGMVGVSGIAMRLFTALAREKINIILISQASSENTISIAIEESLAEKAEESIRGEFEKEIAKELINRVLVEVNLSIVAIVGENMKHSTGVAGKLFSTIGRNGINVVAIAQGASEFNISWVVRNGDLRKTLNVVHESFFLSENVQLNLFLIGTGLVGSHLLSQIGGQQERLLRESHLNIRLAGIANRKNMLFDRDGIEVNRYAENLSEKGEPSSVKGFIEKMISLNMYNSVFVDCTASGEVAAAYQQILEENISIVAANKIAASSSFDNYIRLKRTAKRKGIKFLFETNVGAGLPIINTLNDLVNSGDKVLKIEAVLSGTLNFIFNTLSAEIPLSKTIRMAREAGYTEPDPRVDLSGTDVMRKLLILARESGYRLDPEDVRVNPFIPLEYFEGNLEEFWRKIPALDPVFEEKRKILAQQDKKWRFVASFEDGNAEVGLREIDSRHPFYDLEGSNNLIIYRTVRYNDFPMLIKGYGAGAAVTAAGVFADLIKVSNI